MAAGPSLLKVACFRFQSAMGNQRAYDLQATAAVADLSRLMLGVYRPRRTTIPDVEGLEAKMLTAVRSQHVSAVGPTRKTRDPEPEGLEARIKRRRLALRQGLLC